MARKKSAQNILVWILMAMLVVGLAGFGIDGFLSQTVRSIGQVGGRDISTNSYARSLQQEIRAIEQQVGQAIPFAQLQAMGLDTQVRARLVTQAALEAEAERIGISAGDESVQRTITAIPAFQGPGGSFDRDTYRFTLQNAGQSVSEFESEIRRDAARSILQTATAAGVDTPAALRDALLNYYAARNDFAVFTLGEEQLQTPVPAPAEAEIEAFYAANPETFTAPEIRTITYALLTPAMVIDTIEVEEEALRQLYESRLADYIQPERRLVERLVFPDADSAAAAVARIEAGEATFEAIVAERGLSLDDTDMGDVTQQGLGAAGEAVFSLTAPGSVTGPHTTSVGPAIFRMNAILSAQEVPLEEVADELRTELAADRARRLIADDLDLYEDLLAGGATIEDLAAETLMELGQIDWSVGASDGVAAYTEFREAAGTVAEGDFPEVLGLADGGIFALRLDSITPPAPRPLADVRNEAAEGARAQAVEVALVEQAQALSAALASDGVNAFAEAQEMPFDSFEHVTRADTLPGLPEALLDAVFDAEPGAPVVQVTEQRAFIAIVTDRQPPDTEDAQTLRLVGAIDEQIGGALAQDVFGYFARALEREAGISFNEAAIEAVHANFR
ncbi:peptidylprolyl isomerase [Pararhodobacter sp.]|uniref:peptidylprolyl isomerase n=1 Tax=Pararhodobacter sp. TaxID=2127056 RepID=UPI002FDDF1F7